MPIGPGTRLGVYEVVVPLGAGGMGEVYRATDTNLGRHVAIKVLPEAFGNDPERVARFEREAKTLASLNHRNIAIIHGLEKSEGTYALVMELVEGEDLSQRIARGPIPLDEALPIAKQIAEALEAAHEQGIIHRDLKPANIKVKDDGTVKVLDFGLAKLVEQAAPSTTGPSGLSMSPTITSPALVSGVGVLLGTAAYMSPEQAKGRPADKRSDVWAFGCVLYEMLTGKRAFAGDEVADVLASVLAREPDWNALSVNVSPGVRTLLRRCLEKDRRKRVADISTAIFVIDESSSTTAPAFGPAIPPSRSSIWRRMIPFIATAALAAGMVGIVAWRFNPFTNPGAITRFSMMLAEDERFTNAGRQMVAMAPDGTRMTYVANGQLYLRSMSDADAKPISGMRAERGGVLNPVFSPDGRSIAFWSAADDTIKRIPIDGGRPVTICSADRPYGVSWDAAGILFGQGPAGILRVNASGGKPEKVVKVAVGEIADGPQMLPDGEHVLFTVATGTSADRWDRAKVVVESIKSAERKIVVEGGSDGRYLPTGHIVYAIGRTLFAAPFDVRRLELTGEAVPILEGISRPETPAQQTGIAHYSVSSTGSLMYVPQMTAAQSLRDLVWLDRKGVAERLKVPPGSYEFPRVSPDGKHLALGTDDGKEAIVWIYDLATTNPMRRLTFGGNNRFPIWSADGERVAFQSDRDGNHGIFWQRADGSGDAERLTKPEKGIAHIPDAWTPEGEMFLFSAFDGNRSSLWTFSTRERKAETFDSVSHASGNLPLGVIAPNGRWVAYELVESGVVGIFVQPFPTTGAKYQIARDGRGPVWSHDGREVLFAVGNFQFFAVSVTAQPVFSVGEPVPIPNSRILGAASSLGVPRSFDVAPDGRIIGVTDAASTSSAVARPARIEVVINWFDELKRLVPNK